MVGHFLGSFGPLVKFVACEFAKLRGHETDQNLHGSGMRTILRHHRVGLDRWGSLPTTPEHSREKFLFMFKDRLGGHNRSPMDKQPQNTKRGKWIICWTDMGKGGKAFTNVNFWGRSVGNSELMFRIAPAFSHCR